jgi:tetratricopeptide (TPR) repeat protein
VERAEQALYRAGLRAIRLSANERAVEHFSRALALIGRLPAGDARIRREAELQVQLGVALVALRGLGAPEVEQAYTRATELMLASTSTAEQFPAHFGLSIYHGMHGNFDRSTRLVDRLTELASKGDDSMKLQALHGRWMNSLFAGRIDDAVAAADDARVIYRPEAHHQLSFLYGNHDPGVCALALQAIAFALRGESARAVDQMHEAVSLAEALGHAATLAQPLTQLPWVLQINGDPEAALIESERALALEAEVVHPQFFGIAHAMRGWALARLGRDEEGVVELKRALADELRLSDIWAAMIGALLAEVYLRLGRPTAARHVLDEMLALTRTMPSHVFEPELLRAEAAWLRMGGREDDARQLLLRAISTAREHGSWALAIRSALALARPHSAARTGALKLLGELCERLPLDNATDYARDARALLGNGSTSSRR